jgi:hypothetical protein
VFNPQEKELETIVLADQDTLETDAMLNHQLLAEMKIVTPTDDVTMKTDVFVMLDFLEITVILKCQETASLSLLPSAETASPWRT